jgi:ParB-like chromosome segregation protein Spo0J
MPRRRNGYAVSRDLNPQLVEVAGLKPLGREARKHPPGQIRKLAASLERFGFVLPILIDPQQRVVAGWGLVLAAKQLGLNEVPAIRLTDLSEPELRALRLALNRITEDADWEREELTIELSEILKLAPEIELQVTGFEVAEIDRILQGDGPDQEDHLDEVPSIAAGYVPVTRAGDAWVLGPHRLLCDDASMAQSYECLLGAEKAAMMFADLPALIDGEVSGLGAVKHGKLARALREPSSFMGFLREVLGHSARCSTNGAIHFACTHWPCAKEVILVGEEIYGELQDLCIWNKTNAGRDARAGSLYLPRHELVFMFRVGGGAHINNAALGRRGRTRTNVWDYRSPDVPDAAAKAKLAPPSSTKPVAMVADAIRDCCGRGDVILDPFGGTGTTLIAAEHTGRRARVIELEPIFVDAAIERWQRLTGRIARHADTGRPFAPPAKTNVPFSKE